MRKNRRVKPLAIGQRIRVIKSGMSWSGVPVPVGTEGIVYIHPKSPRMVSVHFDGFDQLQRNGYPYGIGAFPDKPYVPDWAELA